MEFALVMPLLFLILFAIVDYGLFFANSLSVRQGVREAARQGVVETAAVGSCATLSGFLAQLGCTTKGEVGALTGHTYVKTFYNGSWATGARLTVCSMVRTDGLVGLVPYPDEGYVHARTDMAIEVTNPVPAGAASYQDTPPTGQDWSWCS